MRKSKMKVKVITNYDGFRADIIEDEIERIPVYRGKGANRFPTVSYKSVRYQVFSLPESYGSIAGSVIAVSGTDFNK